ncbi:uncharacterized protein LOC134206066 [Armigeres subalbatus]|uniref:uncharacterized protein LOC134206066 n=1 Tax=Armigeres subalbatus TaxID=124917 RepID=UPI002ED125FD
MQQSNSSKIGSSGQLPVKSTATTSTIPFPEKPCSGTGQTDCHGQNRQNRCRAGIPNSRGVGDERCMTTDKDTENCMYNYEFLNAEHEEENMEPKRKKGKTTKPIVVDSATLNKMRLTYESIRQKNDSELQPSKIPLSVSVKLKPSCVAYDCRVKAEQMTTSSSLDQTLQTTANTSTTSGIYKPMAGISARVDNCVEQFLRTNTSTAEHVASFTELQPSKIPLSASVKLKPSCVASDSRVKTEQMTTSSSLDQTLQTTTNTSIAAGIYEPLAGFSARVDNCVEQLLRTNTSTAQPVSKLHPSKIPLGVSVKLKPYSATSNRRVETEKSNARSSVDKAKSLVKTTNNSITASLYELKAGVLDDIGDREEKCLWTDSSTSEPEASFSGQQKSCTVSSFDFMEKLNNITTHLQTMEVNIGRKLDAVNSNGQTIKRILGTLNEEIKGIKKNLPNDVDPVKICFPITNDDTLMELDVGLREENREKELRQLFLRQGRQSMYDFMRANVDNIFRNTSRYTYSGKAAVNSRHHDDVKNASNLNIVRILLDVAMELFKESRDSCIQTFKKALQNFNAARHMQEVRHKPNE